MLAITGRNVISLTAYNSRSSLATKSHDKAVRISGDLQDSSSLITAVRVVPLGHLEEWGNQYHGVRRPGSGL